MGIDPSGRRLRRKTSARTKKEAQQRLRDLQGLVARGLPVGDGILTVRRFLEEWLKGRVPTLPKVKSTNTRDNYAWAVREHLVPSLGAKRLVALTADDVDAMLSAKVADGLSTSSIRRILTVLRRALRDAEKRGKVQRNVAMFVDIPDTHERQGRSLTVDEAKALLAAARGERLEAAWWLGVCLGLRPGEIFGLSWQAVDFDAGVLHVVRTLKREGSTLVLGDVKTPRSSRSLDLPPSMIRILRNHRSRQVQERLAAPADWNHLDLVFCTPLGNPVDPSNARTALKGVAERASIGRLRVYDLRHTCSSLMSDAGVRVEIIGDVFGHDGTRMQQQVYRHRGTESIRAATLAMEHLFGAS
jgi:integrase